MFVSLWQTTWCILMMQALHNGLESILKVDSYFSGTCVFSIYDTFQHSIFVFFPLHLCTIVWCFKKKKQDALVLIHRVGTENEGMS